MSGSVWSLLTFVFTAAVLGVGFMVMVEEVCSVHKARLRFQVVVGFIPLTMMGMSFMGLARHYLADYLGLVVLTTLGLLGVYGWAVGVGFLVSLLTYKDRLTPNDQSWGFYLLFYLVGGIALPLLSIMNGVTNLQSHHIR